MDKHLKRIEYLDFARGISMICVIWGHIMLFGTTNILVYAFDIPLFFFLSGMMFRPSRYDNFKSMLSHTFKGLLLPYIIASLFTWIYWVIFSNIFKLGEWNRWGSLLQTFISQGSVGYLSHNVPLWFVMCLFSTQIIYFFISKLNDYINIMICIVCAIGGYLLSKNGFTDLPWNIESALTAMPFFAIGHLTVKHFGLNIFNDLYDKHRRKTGIALVIISYTFLFLALYNSRITIGSNIFGNNAFMMYVVGFLGIASTLLYSTFTCKVINEKFIKLILFIGENSFLFMCLHFPIFSSINTIVKKIANLPQEYLFSSYLYNIVVTIITIALCCLLIKLINATKSKLKNRKAKE